MNNNITILNFSSRNKGNCASISSLVAAHYSNANICIYSIKEYFGACNRCDYECLKPNKLCPSYTTKREVMDTIMNSDLVYYVVPNYCGFPCANYFAFNEQTVGYFNLDRVLMNQYMAIKKRFIIVSNSESEIFMQAMQQQSEDPDILYLKTVNYGKQSIDGDMMNSEAAIAELNRFLNKE